MSGTGPGRRWQTRQVVYAMILRLAGEFQGYSRDLHDLAAEVFATQLGDGAPAVEGAVRILATRNRKLDTGNAQPGALGNDFGALDLQLWPELQAAYSSRASDWNKNLEALNTARNGIAHDDSSKLAKVESDGYRIAQVATFTRLRKSMDQLAHAMDDVVAGHCADLFSIARPW